MSSDDDVLVSPTSAETRAWVQALTAKWPAAAAPAGPPREPSWLYLLALPIVMTVWFWAPWLSTKILDFFAWGVAYVSIGGGNLY